MIKVPISSITEIKDDTLSYLDYNASIITIELEQCANNYEATYSLLHKENLKVRCIGKRLFSDYAYYEIYATEHIQFYMNLKTNKLKKIISKICGWNFWAKDFQQFYTIQKRLNDNGWTTLDLS